MQIELLIGSIGITLSIFFSLLLLNRKNKAPTNIFLAIYLLAFGLRIGKSLFHNYFDFSPTLRTYFINMLFCVGPAIWLFTKYLVYPSIHKIRVELLHFALFLILLPICWFIPNNGSLAFALFYNATILHMLGYIIYSIFWFRKNQKRVPTKKENQIRNFWNAFLGANLLIVIGYLLISQLILPYYMGFSFSFSFLIVFFGVWALKIPHLFLNRKEKYQASNLSMEQAEQLYKKLIVLMEKEKRYLDTSLSLSKLSEQIGATAKEISQSINQVEQINYAQFISRFRLDEAKRLLHSPTHAQSKISTIAYESGFHSLSSFNSLFKKNTSLTPQAYRNLKK